MKYHFAVFLLAIITGCSTSPEQQARLEQQRLDAATKQCASYGFEPNKSPFAQCIMQIDQAKRQAITENNDREYRCRFAKAAGYAAPTQSGNFGEAFERANAFYNNCMAGLPPPQKLNIICNKNPVNNYVSCQER